MENLEVGSTIGDYQIVGILGAGGMGKVYKVRNVISDRVEAMKVLLPDLMQYPELADRFMREIKVQASLEHPHIAGLHTALRVNNQLLMLMEFVEGQTLEHRLKEGVLPVQEAVHYIAQVLAALAYAHQHGVIHRDIKPANMMLTHGGVVKLMDFGIAKAASDHRLTSTGMTMGSLYYMSPEQIKGASDLDARADLYSVGVSLYELVTGRHPFDGDSQFAIMSAHLEKTPVPPIQIDPRLPQALNDVVLMSVAKSPNERFQTADAFRNALLGILSQVAPAASIAAATAGGATIPSPPPQQQQQHIMPPPQQQQQVRPSGGHRGLWVAAGALCTVAAVVGLIQFGPWKKTDASSLPPVTQQVTQQQTPVQQAPVQQSPVQQSPVVTNPSSQQQRVDTPPPLQQKPSQQQQQQPKMVAQNPVQQMPVQQQPQYQAPVQQPPVQQQTAPPPPQPQPQHQAVQAPQQPSAAEIAKRAELQTLREQWAGISTRANAANGTMSNMQRSQAASGLGMRRDMVTAQSTVGSNLEGANQAINAGDVENAKKFLQRAELNLQKIENWLSGQ